MQGSKKKKNLNCSVSYGQAAVTFCLPGATSCSFKELILLEDDLPLPFPFSKSDLKVTYIANKSTCPGPLEGMFSSPENNQQITENRTQYCKYSVSKLSISSAQQSKW